jgi:acyl-CoA reductase-like NAD-dependent aldehyde dehydrogenase
MLIDINLTGAIAQEAGIPEGVLNCLPTSREHVKVVGAAMCANSYIR